MASLVLYGSTTADTTLTNACVASAATGGTETSYAVLFPGSGQYGEVTSHRNASGATVTAIPTTPTGWGWVYHVSGGGTFATGNWSLVTPMLCTVAGEPATFTLRFFKYSSGTYTSIGSITTASANLPTTKTSISFPATSMSTVTFASGDILYWDIWLHDTTGAGGDEPTMYVSNSSAAGVAGDMQLTTSSFTPAGPVTTNYTVTEQGPTEVETISRTGFLTVSEQGPTEVETISAVTITRYPAINDQATGYSESVTFSIAYKVNDQATSYSETVFVGVPTSVIEQAPTYTESITTFTAIVITEQGPTEVETVKITSFITVIEQAPTYTETDTYSSLVPIHQYSVTELAPTYMEGVGILITTIYTVIEQAPTEAETIVTTPSTQSLPGAPMTNFDLETQYGRIEASALLDRLQFAAIIYYSAGGASKILYGEIDALLDGEDISMLHVMKTINDVNAFLAMYDYTLSIIEDNPIAYLRVGDASGAGAADSSGNNFNATVNGTVAVGQPGAILGDPNTAMLLNGGYLALPSALNTTSWGAMSVETWIKLSNNTFTNNPGIIGNSRADSTHVGFSIILAPASDGTASGYASIGFGTSVCTVSFGTPGVFNASQWYHIVLRYDGINTAVYVNGVNATLAVLVSGSGLIAAAAGPVYVGCYSDLSNNFLGLVDEIGIYPYALDTARILYRYQIARGLAI